MSTLLQPEALISLVTLSVLEIVLGIDNIVFIAILVERLPPRDRPRIRRIGLALALVMRLVLLFTITWVMRLTVPLFAVFGKGFSGRDLILLAGGLFLLAKASYEIYDKLEVSHPEGRAAGGVSPAVWVLVQIVLLDIVFSLDSVITAIGMANHLTVMVIAVMLAVVVMLVFANRISSFIEQHPTLKMLALSFLLLIGVMLVAEGIGTHFNKGYIYFAMTFSLLVECLNIRTTVKEKRRQQTARVDD